MDEELIYQLLEKVKAGGVSKASLEAQGFADWSPQETANLLKSLLTAKLVSDQNGVLQIEKKGHFFWKRVRRKKQGFV